MRTFVTSSFERCLKDLPAERREEIIGIIRRVGEQFGKSHAHSGLAIRPFGAEYECRDAIKNRLVFKLKPDGLWFVFYGDHKAVKNRSKNLGS